MCYVSRQQTADILFTFRNVNFVHEPRENVAVVNTEVVVRAEHVGRNDSCEVAAVLLVVRTVKLSKVNTQRIL